MVPPVILILQNHVLALQTFNQCMIASNNLNQHFMSDAIHTIHDKSLTPAAASAVAALRRRQLEENQTWSVPPTTLAATGTTTTAVMATNRETPASKLESSTTTTTTTTSVWSRSRRADGVTTLTQRIINLEVERDIDGSVGCDIDIAGKAAMQQELEGVKTAGITGGVVSGVHIGGRMQTPYSTLLLYTIVISGIVALSALKIDQATDSTEGIQKEDLYDFNIVALDIGYMTVVVMTSQMVSRTEMTKSSVFENQDGP
ncbi:hypothetical protein C8J56DRAFT_893061 [Mycena floridula]|nr:hypothetical protein C8J56DRAFT_893061 [Mycena floridula]